MKCRQHPERWPQSGLLPTELDAICECQECLEVLEYRINLEIQNGDIPPVSAGFENRVMSRIDKSLLTTGTPKWISFAHYVAAAAATIAMLLMGGFNTICQTGSEYSSTLTRHIDSITRTTVDVSANMSEAVDNSARNGWAKNMVDGIEYFVELKPFVKTDLQMDEKNDR